MTDYFALLEIERRPSLPEDLLKAAYLRKSEAFSANAIDVETSTSLNAAYRTLSNPVGRIQHLLTLEYGDAKGGQLGPDLGDLFGRIAEIVQSADQEIDSVSAQASALLRAIAFQRTRDARKRLEETESQLREREQDLLSQIQRLDEIWSRNPAQCRAPLAQIALSLTFVQKWLNEVHERKICLEELA